MKATSLGHHWAIVGRPNVGKSSIFNTLIGKRQALVHNLPGVTRDVLCGHVQLQTHRLPLYDTGGLEFGQQSPLMQQVYARTLKIVQTAAQLLLVVDGQVGLTAADRDVAQWARKSGIATWVVCNKIDDPKHFAYVHECHRLGFAQVFGVSAEHKHGFGALLEAMEQRLTEQPMAAALATTTAAMPTDGATVSLCNVAVIGRPNAGKSSLINALLGETRMVTSTLPGTTHDSVDVTVQWNDKPYTLMDTAGIRRKRVIDARLEQLMVSKALKSIERADVVVLLLDGARSPSVQDAHLAQRVVGLGKGLVVAANKWDLVSNPQWALAYLQAVRKAMPNLAFAPLVKLSALSGKGIARLMQVVAQVQTQRQRRIGTGELNRFFGERVAHRQPPVYAGKRVQLYYVSQPMTNPPTFVFSSSSSHIPVPYQRYLENALRNAYGFAGSPLWLKFRVHRPARGDGVAAKT